MTRAQRISLIVVTVVGLAVIVGLVVDHRSSSPAAADPVLAHLSKACAIEDGIIDKVSRHTMTPAEASGDMERAAGEVAAASGIVGVDELRRADLQGLDQQVPSVNRLMLERQTNFLGTPGLSDVLDACAAVDRQLAAG